MSRKIIFVCNGREQHCHKDLEIPVRTTEEADVLARNIGWVFPDCTHDLCPICAYAARPSEPGKPKKCRLCAGVAEFSDALGHDRRGHLAANVLFGLGLHTWKQLRTISEEGLAELRKLGPVSRERVEQTLRIAREQAGSAD